MVELNTMPSLPDFLRAARQRRGLSARQLSSRAGLSLSYVNKVEAGQLEPGLRAFARLAVELSLTEREVHFLVWRMARS